MATVTATPSGPSPSRPRPRGLPPRRRARRVLTVACVFCLGVARRGRGRRSRSRSSEGRGEAHAYSPPDVTPLIHPKLPEEGARQKAGAGVGPRPPVLLTTFRSDPEYPQFVAGVAWLDHSRTELAYVPGLVEPPEPLEDRGSGEVPAGMCRRLVATFNGGFPLETAEGRLVREAEPPADHLRRQAEPQPG